MAKIEVKYIGLIRQVVTEKKREEAIDIEEGQTLGGLIDILSNKYGERFRYTILMHDDSLNTVIRVVIDGVEVSDLGPNLDKKKKIVIAIPFPFPGGGCGFRHVPGSGCRSLSAQ